MRILKTELYKLIHRREFYISLSFLTLFSLIFSVLLGTDSNVMELSGGGGVSASMFTVFIVQFISSFFGLVIINGVITANIWAGELLDGTISQLILKAKNRGALFINKVLVSYICGFIYFICIIVSSSIFYIAIGRYGEYYISNYFEITGEMYPIFIIITVLYMMFITSLMVFLSVNLSSMKALLTMIGIFILFKILERIDKIKEILPTYLSDAQHIFTDSWENRDTIIAILLMIFYIVLLNFAAYTIFKKKDI